MDQNGETSETSFAFESATSHTGGILEEDLRELSSIWNQIGSTQVASNQDEGYSYAALDDNDAVGENALKSPIPDSGSNLVNSQSPNQINEIHQALQEDSEGSPRLNHANTEESVRSADDKDEEVNKLRALLVAKEAELESSNEKVQILTKDLDAQKVLLEEKEEELGRKDAEIFRVKEELSIALREKDDALSSVRRECDLNVEQLNKLEEEIQILRQQRLEDESIIKSLKEQDTPSTESEAQVGKNIGQDTSQKIDAQFEDAQRLIRKLEAELESVREEAAANAARFDVMLSGEPGPWVQHAHDLDMPIPRHVTLESPVIQTILQAWTQDPKNLSFFNKWCAYILSGGDVGPSARFQRGVELSKCTPNVKDGILSMLVPMLRSRPGIEVSVFTREKLQVYHDVRLRVTKADPVVQ